MDIENMMYYIAVCKYMNITKAAEMLHISQPALSRRIMALEQEFNSSFFYRSGGNIELTPAGKIFLAEAKGMIIQQQKMAKRMERFRHGNAISVGFSPNVNMRFLIEWIEKVHIRSPNLKFYYQENNMRSNIEDLLQEKLDVIFTTRGEVEDSSKIKYETLVENDISVIVPKGHPLWNKRTITIEDLLREPICTIRENLYNNTTWSRALIALNDIGLQFEKIPNFVYCDTMRELYLYVCTMQRVGIGDMIGSVESTMYPDRIRMVYLEGLHVPYGDLVLACRAEDTKTWDLIKQYK